MKVSYYNIVIAANAIRANKARSVLTALGIIFGVAAVIVMLAIGKGTQQIILKQLEMVGVNNFVIQAVKIDPETMNDSDSKEGKKYNPGLSLSDLNCIQRTLPTIKMICPEVQYQTYSIGNSKKASTKLIGVSSDYFNLFNLKLSAGSFFKAQQAEAQKQICVIGSGIAKKIFPSSNPIGKWIKCGHLHLKVIGVIEAMNINGTSLSELGINDYNDEVYAPIQTILLRFKNRGLITQKNIVQGNKEETETRKNLNQLDKIVIQVKETEDLKPTVEVVNRLMNRRHLGSESFEIIVPENQLKQKKESEDIMNYLLGAIASISLMVGGIGIMNIMLASVMERIKEIGLRLAIGAKKTDIRQQFIFEALLISITGGVLGILIGWGLSEVINMYIMPTVISPLSIIISFAVSVGVGICFGYFPARKAAEQDPVNSLRYE